MRRADRLFLIIHTLRGRRAVTARRLAETPRVSARPADLDALHEAIESRHLVRFAYARPDGAASQRDVEPVCLAFWGRVWTLGAWCRMRQDFRNFRLDRMAGMHVLQETYPDDPARGLRAFLASVGANPDAEI